MLQLRADARDAAGMKVACLEEIAFRLGFINRDQLLILAKSLEKSGNGKYPTDLIESVEIGHEILKSRARVNGAINRINLAADLARVHWQLPVMAGAAILARHCSAGPRDRTQRLVGMGKVVPTIGGG
jgi:hypothetical protein